MENRNICRVANLFLILIFSFPLTISSLERDYSYSGSYLDDDRDPEETAYGEYIYYYNSDELCYECFKKACGQKFSIQLEKEIDISCIPSFKCDYYDKCTACNSPLIYSGYFHFRYNKNFPFLKRQIEYTNKYPHYQAYWPETSVRAEKISDLAFLLFEDLISTTALEKVSDSRVLYKKFMIDTWYFKGLKGILFPISLISNCFRFSDYFVLCSDIKNFSKSNFSHVDYDLIETKLDKIIDKLAESFRGLYEESLKLYPTKEIQEEISFIDYIYTPQKQLNETNFISQINQNQYRYSPQAAKPKNLISKEFVNNSAALQDSVQPDWFMLEFYLWKGVVCNDLLLYSDAIEVLSDAIRIEPNKIEAYMERAHAYFEIDKLNLAIEDYKKINELKNQIPIKKSIQGYLVSDEIIYPKGSIEYSSGFCSGVFDGSEVSLIEFVPSTLSCCRGILHGLWSLACSPNEVSNEVINSSYILIEYLRTHTASDCLEMLVPEYKDLCLNWEKLSDYERGKKTGYIIGKYGLDILTPGLAISGINKFRQFKRANSMFTIECCVISEAKKSKILEQSSKHFNLNFFCKESIKKGKIVALNSNVSSHVMQKKHLWEKVIKLTGNTKVDFANVIQFLENNQILKGNKRLIGEFPIGVSNPKIQRYRYKIEVNGKKIEADFIEYIESKELYINDAWVISD